MVVALAALGVALPAGLAEAALDGVHGRAYAALLDTAASPYSLEVRASTVRITTYEERDIVVAGVAAVQEPFTARGADEFVNATIRIDGAVPGFVGFYGNRLGEMSFRPREHFVIEVRGSSTLATHLSSNPDPPASSWFNQGVDVPHAYVESDGVVGFAGPWAMKVNGPVIHVSSSAEDVNLPTGPDDGDLMERTTRWVYLEFPDAEGTLTVEGEGLKALLLRETVATVPASGSGVMGGAGEAFPVPAPSRWLLPGALALGVVVGAAATRLVLRSSRPPPRRTPRSLESVVDEAIVIARDAAEREEWDEALVWTRRARDAAPSSAALLMDEAFFLEKLGRKRDALALYDEAAERTPDDGDADFHAANLMLQLGASAAEAGDRFARCLDRSPDLVHELLDPAHEEAYRALFAERAFRRAVEDAIRRSWRA